MPYRIVNLISTRKDPSARGRTPLLARKPVLIGTRILHPGQTCTIGDAYYERSKARIKEYVSQGVITAQYFAQVEQTATTPPDWTPPADHVASDTPVETDMPVFDTDAEQLEALALAAVPIEVEVEVAAAIAEEPTVEPQEAVVEEEKPVEKVEEKKPSKADDLDALLAAPPKRNKKG